MNSVYYIGIDGGGTKTEAVMTTQEGQMIARSLACATNPNDVGVETSVRLMTSLTNDLLSQTGIDASQVYLFAGISGAINHKDELEFGMHQTLPRLAHIEIGSDIVNLIYAELPLGDGACVICGTGSACFLRCEEQLYRIGGWGYLLDSAGSGYDFGRMALESVLKAHDGRGKSTMLTELLADHLGKPVQDALSDIYAQGKPYIASCAPFVFKAAAMGDEVAEEIMNINAQALADMISTACKKQQQFGKPIGKPLPVALGGGINQKEAPAWTQRIQKHLSCPEQADLFVAEVPMVVGAVLKAITCQNRLISPQNYADYAKNIKRSYSAFMQKA